MSKRATIGQTIAEQWKAEGAREMVETELMIRFGPLSDETSQALAQADIETMKGWLRNASTAATIEEVGILPPETAR